MEVTALSVRLLINVAVLLPAQVQHSFSHRAEATFPRIVPSRLQFFEYESFSVNCKGFFHDLTKWRVMRNIQGTNTTCKDKCEMRGTYNITAAFSIDSGEYWCEVDGKKSNKVNIIVTEGSVILDSPALPVMEGDNVVLRCKNKKTFRIEADFYKNGVLMWRSSTVEMTIHNVSKSDEGLYKCRISGIGESAESWLAVRESVILEIPALPVMEGDRVTLRCRNKMTSNFPAVFYKDGLLIRNSSTGEMIIHSVSKSDEGLYKCTSGVGESAVPQPLIPLFQCPLLYKQIRLNP
ncbi:high affinity immunoglobulin gamma Fc receptor I-like [Morone saxatilis]|uniref:high affinity immunoglobulin gamma Fc receptor I-like n=1 Tax=Morone saxatilis TaxID=34816 RepID=UPI0015E23572|nr:high affinity immunoglobulin gamma Fc receptor I-like [Morone saxatilis]